MNYWGGRAARRSRMEVPVMLAASMLLMAGCTADGTIGAKPPALSAAPDADGQAASPTPAPEAAGTVAAVQDALDALAGQTGKPSTEEVLGALNAAGFTGSGVEVTLTRTPTGLEADAVEAAVLDGRECIMGHVREGSVTVTVLPVLASGRCFLGSEIQ